ncbi:MAG: alkylphosphonate utilization protein [Bacteroidetes bacterium]|nr:alkylphosphonate utilization protein [Bacteroidota bacterium]
MLKIYRSRALLFFPHAILHSSRIQYYFDILTLYQNSYSVILIKNLPVKGAPKPIKAGTKVNNIKLVDSDHNIDCRIEGFGAMAIKSEFVRKA